MNGKKLCAALLSLTLCAALLTACGGGGSGGASKAGAGASGTNAAKVSDVASLLDAIAPGAEIVLAPGYYNMSDVINGLWLTEGDAWNAAHDYVELRDCYDGAEVIIKNADGLSVSGDGAAAATEIVIDPRYATVFTFENCKNVKLSSLTLGHTETGYCAGNVINLSACENVELRNMDLYGCGVVGLDCYDGTGDVFVYDSVLRDCSDGGPVQIFGGVGKFEFYDCFLTGSEGGGYYDNAGRSSVSFHNCTFGENETNFWAFKDGVEMENCTLAEATMYPDYGYDAPESLPDDLRPLTFDPDSHTEMSWMAYELRDAETGNPLDIPSGKSAEEVRLILRRDGTGVISDYYADRLLPFLWEQTGAATLSLTTLHDGILTAAFYDPGLGDNSGVCVSVRIGNALLWLF